MIPGRGAQCQLRYKTLRESVSLSVFPDNTDALHLHKPHTEERSRERRHWPQKERSKASVFSANVEMDKSPRKVKRTEG